MSTKYGNVKMKSFNVIALCFLCVTCIFLPESSTKCIPEFVTQTGQYYIVGLFSMYPSVNSSTLDKNAIRIHLKLRYFIGRMRSINRNVKIGFVSFNVCNNAESLTHPLTSIYLNPFFNPTDQTIQKKCKTRCKNCSCAITRSNIIAVISYMPIFLTQIASNVMSLGDIPIYAYTTQKWNMHQKVQYSSYDLINKEIFDVDREVKYFNVKRVALVKIGKAVTGVASFHQSSLWNMLIKQKNVCVQTTILNQNNISSIERYVDTIRRDKALQMVIIWSNMESRRKIINLADGINDKIWYWYTSYSFDNNISYNISPESLQTHVFIVHPIYSYGHLNTIFSYKKMTKKISPFAFQAILADKWIRKFIQEQGLKTTDTMFEIFDIKDSMNDEYIESLLTPLWWSQPFKTLSRYAIQSMWQRLEFITQTRLRKHVYNNATKTFYISTSYSDVIKLFYSLKKHKKGCEKMKCPLGRQPVHERYFDNLSATEKYDWHCVTCPEGHIKSKYGKDLCKRCEGFTRPNVNNSQCYDPFSDRYFNKENSIAVMLTLLSSFGAAFSLVIIIVFVRFRNTPIVRSSGMATSMLQLGCHLSLFIALPFLLLNKPTALKCFLQPVLFGLLLTIISALTLTKTQKLLYAFHAIVRLSKRTVMMSKAVFIFILVFIITIQLLLSLVAYIQHPPDVVKILNYDTLTRDLQCANQSHINTEYFYILALSFFSAIQAYRSRRLPKHFNETKATTYSMFVTILTLVALILVRNSQPGKTAEVAFDFLAICMINLTQLLLTYCYKTYVVMFHPCKNTKQAFQLSMMYSAHKNVERSMRSSLGSLTSVLDS